MIRPGIRRLFRLRMRRRERVERELEDEIRLHLKLRIEQLRRQGLSTEAARTEALRRFGDLGEARARLGAAVERREKRRRRRELLDELRQDVRYGVRALARAPGFTAVAVCTLALGIGASTAIFSVVDGVLVRALPYTAPDRLVSLWETSPTGEQRNVVSSGNYLDWRDQSRVFGELGAYGWEFGVTLTGLGDAVRVLGTVATPSTFRLLGVRPVLGRTFTRDEEVPGSGRVVLISHGFWQRRFGGDPGVLGRAITLNGGSYDVVGVMPPDFRFPSHNAEFWLPLRFGAEDGNSRRAHQWRVIGRLLSGQTPAQARAEMEGIAARITAAHPEFMTGWGVRVAPYRADLVGDVRPLLLVLLAATGLVLLVACANVANLLLARAVAREQEVALRAALGAGRARLLRQFLTESGLLAVVGGAAALIVLALSMNGLLALAPPDIPLLHETRMDARVLAFALGLTVASTVLCGLLPALRASRSDIQSTLRDTGSPLAAVRHRRVRNALLVFEVAVSAVLLIGAGLLARSFATLMRVAYGLDPDRVLTAMVVLPGSRYDGTPDHVRFFDELLNGVRALPGVLAADGTVEPPVVGFNNTFSFSIEGRPRPGPNGQEDPVPVHAVTPGFFRTMRIPVRSGRPFDERDRAGTTAVAIVNAALARRHWPAGDAIGKRISFEGRSGPWLEIVGVVGDTRHMGLEAEPEPTLYIPFAQKPWNWMSWLALMVRTSGDPRALAPAVRAEVRGLDRDLALERLAPVEDLYGESLARRRFATALIGAFAALALVLGIVGIYGVLSYLVAQQRREVGIRMALGARAGQVVRLVLAQGLRLALAGVVLGVLGAIALTRLMAGLLYQTGPRDPATFVAVPLLLLAVSAAACSIPARRAARVDPVRALRSE